MTGPRRARGRAARGTPVRRRRARASKRSIAGWLLDQGRRVDPGALTVALAAAARDLGADIRHHVNVRSLIRCGDRVTGVATDDGVIAADTVILAAGPWSAPLVRPLGIDLPVTGARGWIVELASPPGLLHHLVEEVDGVPEEAERYPTAADLAAGDLARPGRGHHHARRARGHGGPGRLAPSRGSSRGRGPGGAVADRRAREPPRARTGRPHRPGHALGHPADVAGRTTVGGQARRGSLRRDRATGPRASCWAAAPPRWPAP